MDEWGNIVKPRDQVAREKNSSMSRKTTNASVISSFEDDDELYEIKDDPNVINKNKKAAPAKQAKAEPKTETKSESDDVDETDLD